MQRKSDRSRPPNDVNLIKASLEQIRFKVTCSDANYKAMDSALKRYVDQVRVAGAGTVSFFYYSAHGVANSETQINYLIPIDVTDTAANVSIRARLADLHGRSA